MAGLKFCSQSLGNLGYVRLLLERGADINSVNIYGETPLIAATYKGHAEVVQFLVDRGANTEIRDKKYNSTAFEWAIRKGHKEIQKIFSAQTGENITNGYDDQVKLLMKDSNYEKHFILAVQQGNLGLVKAFIENKHNIVNARNNYEWYQGGSGYALHYAVRSGNKPMVQLLINHGANINAVDNDGKETPLFIAIKEGNDEMAQILIDVGSADVNVTDRYGHTPLDVAVGYGRKKMVELLIEKGAKVDVRIIKGHLAGRWIYNNSKDTLKLLESYEIFFNAVYKNDVDTIKECAEKGLYVNVRDSMARTPLHDAAYAGYIDIINVLLQNGARIDEKDDNGTTAVELAVMKGHADVVRALLTESHADINCTNEYGKTLLHKAAELGHTKVVHILLEKGANESAKDKNGLTPLHKAALWGRIDVFKTLMENAIKNGHDINPADKGGHTPLYEARRSSMHIGLKYKGAEYDTVMAKKLEMSEFISQKYKELGISLNEKEEVQAAKSPRGNIDKPTVEKNISVKR